MDRDIVLVCLGGFQVGAFTAGVLSELDPLRDRIYAIYGASVGAMNAAGFVSHALADAWRQYTFQSGVVRPWRVGFGESLDVDEAFAHAASRFDTHAFRDSSIIVKALLCNYDTLEVQYVPLTDLQVLRAAVAVVPYTKKAITIDGKRYVDGAIFDAMHATQIIEECPGKRIIVITNGRYGGSFQLMKDLLEATLFFPRVRLSLRVLRKVSLFRKEQRMLAARRALFLYPGLSFGFLDTSATANERRYDEGKRLGTQLCLQLMKSGTPARFA